MKHRAHFFLPSLLLAFTLATTCAQTPTANISISVDQPGAAISPNLFGIFFEEINFAGEGGLYAELVRNRALGNSTNADYWTLVTQVEASGSMGADSTQPLNTNMPRSLKLTMLSGPGTVGAGNAGFWGMSLQSGATYNLSFYAITTNGFTGTIAARLESSDGTQLYANTFFPGVTGQWQKFSGTLAPNATSTNARLVISISTPGTVWLDVVSLFPQATFHNRTNGVRPDLANLLVNQAPSFMRFPGGNYIEGNNLTNAVRWKKSIGDIAQRPGHENDAWGYWSTDGLGFHEYLQLCEDLGCQPLFGINCGLSLGYNGSTNNTVPLAQMGPWVQDALDAIEYANGDTNTTWGAQRAANGHPAPFNLQYMEIGNENGGSYYNDRYALFYDAIKSNYPAMNLIAPDWGGIPSSRPVEIQDDHYYSSAGVFASYATRYDSYSRSGPKVFVGEYAVTSAYGTLGNLSAALGEAAFMTGMERNSDLVLMASYAPLFGNVNALQWKPDSIYYNNSQVFGTPSHYVQQLFSQNRGDLILPITVTMGSNANTVVYACADYVSSSNQVLIRAVNTNAAAVAATFTLTGLDSVATGGTVTLLTSANATDENSLAAPENVFPVTNSVTGFSTNFTYNLPANSLTIFRVQAAGVHAVTNLVFQFTSPINVNQVVPSTLLAQQSGGGTVNLLTNVMTSRGVSYLSADTTVAIVDNSGNVSGIGPGTTSITAMYNGLAATQAVQVVGVMTPLTTLIHRYSFNDGTANDSIGTNNGTFYNASGHSAITNGQLVLVGTNGDYVDLGPNILTTNSLTTGAVTLEAWASFNSVNGAWARLFDFGAISGSVGGDYIFLAVDNAANGGSGRLAVADGFPGYNYESGFDFDNLLGTTNTHVVVVFDPNADRQFLGLYLNGSLSAFTSTGSSTISSISNNYSFLGHSLYSSDAWLSGSIDEFRIYNGELSAAEIAASDQLGPSQLLSTAPPVMHYSLSSTYLTLTWPLASAGFSLFSASDPSSTNWSTVSPAPQIIAGQWQVSVPMSSAPQYYRLKK